jgi:hypothetical protein
VNFIALDLDSQGLYAVAGAARGTPKVTHALAWTGDEPPPPLTAETAKSIGEQLRDRLKDAGVAPAPVLVTVGRDRIILKELRYPPVPAVDEPAVVRFQALKEMSESPDDIVLDYTPLGETAEERRSMAVVIRRDLFTSIQAMCAAAGLKLAGVTPRPYAIAAGLGRALSGAHENPDEAVGALILGPAGGEFTVVRRGAVTFTLAIPAPVIASQQMLVAQVRRNLVVYAGQHPGHPVRALFVSEVDGEWVPRLAAAVGVPVHGYDPLAGALPGVPDEVRGRFAGAVGLLAGRAADALPINFASPRQPQTAKDPAKRKLAFVGLAALLFLFVAGAGGMWWVAQGDDRIADLTRQRDELKDRVGKGGPDANRLKAIDGWQKREVVWLDELHDLAKRMPADDSVRVSSFVATPLPVGKDGKQEAQARLELKLASTNTASATALETAIVRDNTTPNKFYVGTFHTGGGIGPLSTGKHNQMVTIITKVNRRDPGQFEPTPMFAPVKRTTGSAGISFVPPPPLPMETAPAPTEVKAVPAG